MSTQLDLMEVAKSLPSVKHLCQYVEGDEHTKKQYDKVEHVLRKIARSNLPQVAKNVLIQYVNRQVDQHIREYRKVTDHNVTRNIIGIDNNKLATTAERTKFKLSKLPVIPRQIIEDLSAQLNFVIFQSNILTDPYREAFDKEVDIDPFYYQDEYNYLWILGPIESYSMNKHVHAKDPRPVYGFGSASMIAFVISSNVSVLIDMQRKLEQLNDKVEEAKQMIKSLREQLSKLETHVNALSKSLESVVGEVRKIKLSIEAQQSQISNLEKRVQHLEFICLTDPLVFATKTERFEEAEDVLVIDAFLTGRPKTKPERYKEVELTIGEDLKILDELENLHVMRTGYFTGKVRKLFKQMCQEIADEYNSLMKY